MTLTRPRSNLPSELVRPPSGRQKSDVTPVELAVNATPFGTTNPTRLFRCRILMLAPVTSVCSPPLRRLVQQLQLVVDVFIIVVLTSVFPLWPPRLTVVLVNVFVRVLRLLHPVAPSMFRELLLVRFRPLQGPGEV